VDPDLLKMVKAASLVEFNSTDYAVYLKNVFADDPEFKGLIDTWAQEEIQHGEVLGKWACIADPDFDFKEAIKFFRNGYQVPIEETKSTRGSLCGELVARCVIETGTSSFYTSLGEVAKEPVLKQICAHIAADELRHYKLFYTYMKKYVEIDKLNAFQRALVVLGRIGESEDDELAYAFYAANEKDAQYDRKFFAKEYLGRAAQLFSKHSIDRATAMVLKAAGIRPRGLLMFIASTISWNTFRAKRWTYSRGLISS